MPSAVRVLAAGAGRTGFEPSFDKHCAAANRYGGKIKVRGRVRGKWRSRVLAWGLWVLACARVLPGQVFYQRQRNRAVIYGKEKVYGSIP
jgi:hypothetical protein